MKEYKRSIEEYESILSIMPEALLRSITMRKRKEKITKQQILRFCNFSFPFSQYERI
jgi:hypothetical protein